MINISNLALDITPAEWVVMKTVWANEPCTSRQIIDTILQLTEWKEGTIKSLISRLEKKKLLNKQTIQRPYTFYASVKELEAINATTDHLLQHICHKKHSVILHHLIEAMHLSKEDTHQLIQQLNTKALTAPHTIQCTCPKGQCTCHKGE